MHERRIKKNGKLQYKIIIKQLDFRFLLFLYLIKLSL